MNFILRRGIVCIALVASSWGSEASSNAYAPGVRVLPLLQTNVDGAGQTLVYPTGGPAQVTALLVEIPPGAQTNWHKHPVPCFAYILAGELEVILGDGSLKTVKAGEAVAETVDVLHNGVNRGAVTAKLVMFALGTANQPYAVKSEANPPAKK